MNVLSSIAAGYLRKQKRHTVLTEIGIILSVLMMTAVLVAVSTVLATMRNVSAYTNGTYDVIFNELSKDDVIQISNMDIFEKSCQYGISAYTDQVTSNLDDEYPTVYYLTDRKGELISDSFLRIGTDDTDMFPARMTQVSEGRLPTQDGEIALSEADREYFGDPSVGETIFFAKYECVNKGTEEDPDEAWRETVTSAGFEIPGILDSHYQINKGEIISFTVTGFTAQNSVIYFGDTGMGSFIPQKEKLLLTFNEEQNDFYWNLHHAFQDIGLEIDDFDFAFNQEYLNMINKGVDAKSFNTILYMLIYLVVLFIMFCVRMVIDNSFEISSHERIRQYGVIRAVGASKKQILGILVFEALILSAFGVPVGILLGTGLAYVIFLLIGRMDVLGALSSSYDIFEMLEFSVPVWVIVSSAAIGVFWVLISAVGTGMRVNRMSPVEAMRAAKRKVKLGRPERKKTQGRGGVEWLIAFRSIRRNNKRFLITLVSMAISVVIYAGFSYTADVVAGSFEDTYSESKTPYDYEVTVYDIESEDTAVNAEEMLRSGHFENVQYDSRIVYLVQSNDDTSSNERISGYYYMSLHPINENTYKRLTGKDDYDEFVQSGGIIIDNTVTKNEDTYELYSKVPEEIAACAFVDYATYETQVFGIHGTFESSMDMYSSTNMDVIGCMAEENYQSIVTAIGADSDSLNMGEYDGQPQYLYYRTIYADAAEGDYSAAADWLERHYYDYYTDNHTNETAAYAKLALVKICGYFLVALLSLIAAVNIINIISTNVLNRTSEIGMLRACGMASGQIYKMVFSESVLYAGIASISAFLVIEGMIAIIYAPFALGLGNFNMSDMPVTLSFIEPIKYLVIGAAAAFAVAFAAVIPAVRRIIKTPIVDAVGETE
ncbi:MAG: FtsX-like permease family protein [Oscillospiraceae bacterium]